MTGVTEHVESYYRAVLQQLVPGDRLPSERAVIKELQASRSTVRLVLTKLKGEGILYPVHGKGYFKN